MDTTQTAPLQAEQATAGPGGYVRAFAALAALGLVGVASLAPTLGPVVDELARQPGAPDLPRPVLTLLTLIQPTLLMVTGVAAGTALAPRLGLRSHVAERMRHGTPLWPNLQEDLAGAAAWGVTAALAVVGLDLAFKPLVGELLQQLEAAQPRTLAVTLAGILYGGITEELVMRWGFVSFLMWVPWKLVQGGKDRPRATLAVAAILAAAVLFGLGHLSVVAAQVEPTPALIARTVALNFVGGLVFGVLFWKRSLEAAMVAHGVGHVVFTLVAWAGLAVDVV